MAHAQDQHLALVLIHGIEHEVGIADDRQLTNVGISLGFAL